MASYLEIGIGSIHYRFVFGESDTKIKERLEAIARSMEPPFPESATNAKKLEHATKKVVRILSTYSERLMANQIRDTLNVDVEAQARTGGSFAVGFDESNPTQPVPPSS